MTFATYVDKPLGDGRGANRERDSETFWIVAHTSEPGTFNESDRMDDNLALFLGRDAQETNNIASYHIVTSEEPVAFRFMSDELRPHAAGGGNDEGVHFCIPGTRFQNPEQWMDNITLPFIKTAVRVIADWHLKYGIPLRKLTVAQVRNFEKGLCDHNDISIAFGESNHTDPGPDFPWDFIIDEVHKLVDEPTVNPSPKKVKNMYRACKLEDTSFWYGDGENSFNWPPIDEKEAQLILAEGLLDVKSEQIVHSWANVNIITPRKRNRYVGRPVT